MFEIDWYSSIGLDGLFSYDFDLGSLQSYRAERFAPMKRQKNNDDYAVPILAPALDIHWPLSVAGNTISIAELVYRRYLGVGYNGVGLPADVPADVAEEFDDIFAQEAI